MKRKNIFSIMLLAVLVMSCIIAPSSTYAQTTNLALNKPATASSIEASGFEAAKAVDGNTSTRWASVDPATTAQWIYVDFGTTTAIGRVVLRWEAAYATAYTVQVSNDASTWTNIYSTTTGNGGVDDLTGLSGSGRYLRINATTRGTTYGYSLWELEVYNSSSTPIPPTSTFTRTPTRAVSLTPSRTPTRTATIGATLTRTPTRTLTRTPTQPPSITSTPVSGTPVGINGQLHVCGRQICNQYNQPIQLRGMSTHGIQWYYQCINPASMDALAYDWRADLIRISLYVQEDGYETDPAGFRAKVNTIASLAESRGMYYILDWHMLDPGDPNFNLTLAKQYFQIMAQTHGSKPNVIYEIANEPSGVSWAAIKSYAEQVIPVIRQYDPDGIILIGSRAWSSLGISEGGSAAEIVANPVSGTNLMYTFHFYAASHLTEYRNELSWAADRLPMFVSEWGTQQASGDGANNFTSAQQYIDLMASKKISWASWNFSDDMRTGAAFKTGTCPSGPFTGTAPLKEAGIWVRDHILNPPDNFPQ